jgi:hypothetical protein
VVVVVTDPRGHHATSGEGKQAAARRGTGCLSGRDRRKYRVSHTPDNGQNQLQTVTFLPRTPLPQKCRKPREIPGILRVSGQFHNPTEAPLRNARGTRAPPAVKWRLARRLLVPLVSDGTPIAELSGPPAGSRETGTGSAAHS